MIAFKHIRYQKVSYSEYMNLEFLAEYDNLSYTGFHKVWHSNNGVIISLDIFLSFDEREGEHIDYYNDVVLKIKGG